jgi:hypothetical protein
MMAFVIRLSPGNHPIVIRFRHVAKQPRESPDNSGRLEGWMAETATLSALDVAPMRSRVRRRSDWRRAALLLAPMLLLLALFTYWPILQVLSQSLSVETFGGASHWGLDNFRRCSPIRTSPKRL